MAKGSAVVRRSLGRQLRALRESAGLSAADVYTSPMKVASKTKLQRIEAGQGTVRVADVRLLCDMYGADGTTTQKLTDLALNTAVEGWWEAYGEAMPNWFSLFVELEAAADRVFTYDPELVYGLLQTQAYSRSVIEIDPNLSSAEAELQVRLRTERQRAVLDRTPPLQVATVLGEGALARLVGGQAVMNEQRERLAELNRQGNVEVLILPYSVGAHVAMKGAFTIVSFDNEEDPDVVYLETSAGGRYVEQPALVDRYRTTFDLISQQAVTLEEYLR